VNDFLRLVLESIEFLWPFEKIKPYQRGLYVVAGRWQWEIGPGIYPIIPWFIEVVAESSAWAVVSTSRIDITAQDGTMVVLQAAAKVKIVDLKAAYNSVDAYMETCQERLTTIVATKIAEVDAARLAPEKRSRLLSDLRRWVDEDTKTYGVETMEVNFTTFVTNAKPYRLLGDNAVVAGW
jgi:hypothetical protein